MQKQKIQKQRENYKTWGKTGINIKVHTRLGKNKTGIMAIGLR